MTSPLGLISGRVFFDGNANGLFDPGELGARGVRVTLTGTTSTGASVNVFTDTAADGVFSFFQMAPGEYTLTRDNPDPYLTAPATYGNLGGTVDGNTVSQISLAQGQIEANVQFALKGIPITFVSLRQFMTNTNFADYPGPNAGTGNTAGDRSVQPATNGAVGTGSLTGTVYLDANENGIKDAEETTGVADVEVTLSGIDSTGRAIVQNDRTDSNGVYSFTALDSGNYTLTVSPLVSGHRAGAATVGDLGGLAVRNNQIIDISVTTTAGTGYHFGQLESDNFSTTALTLNAGLLTDTAPPVVALGSTSITPFLSDGITFDATVIGQVSDRTATLLAAFGDSPADGDFVDVSSSIGPDGRFILNLARLKQINGNTDLADGEFKLNLKATLGSETVEEEVTFTLKRTEPGASTLGIEGDSDNNTTLATVDLVGTTDADAFVALILPDGTRRTTTADSNGDYSFDAVSLSMGPNAFVLHVVDTAGNIREVREVFQRKIDGAVTAEDVTADDDDADRVIDLNTIFTDNDTSNSIIRMNTTAGPILVEFFDSVAPTTVRNFFEYLDHASDPYDDVVFHRLATNFVLQGGGFVFEPNKTFSNVDTTIGGNFNGGTEFTTDFKNVIGAIAMAQSNGQVANSQWFFNLNNNTSLDASLGNGTGPFAVFGRVLGGADLRTVNTLAAFDVTDQSATNSAFNTFPTRDFASTDTFPADVEKENLALVDSIDILRRAEELVYSIVTNTNNAAVSASIVRNRLTLNFNPDLVSDTSSNITIRATDEFGSSRDTVIAVNITVTPAPFTGADNTTFTVGTEESFTVTTTAADNDLTVTGTLPAGITFTDNDDGTATIAGTPADGSAGTYTLAITADNGTTEVTQNFTLKVADVPAITSADSTSFVIGTSGNFIVTTTGSPAAELTVAGSLPTGVTFVDNNNGTATLSGTPAAGTAGVFNLTITADNGAVPNATQSFTLTVNQAPAITSANNTVFTEGTEGTFTVTTTGSPTAALTHTGTLPSGVTFTDNNDGTATITGTPADGTGGTHSITITASNGAGNNATQTFTLTVNEEPEFTSADATTFTVDTAGTFTVDTDGFPNAAITRGGDALPSGVSFTNNGNGTATLAGTPEAGTGGAYTFTFTADNGIGADAVQSFTLTVNEAPAITSANNATFTVGTPDSFTITTTGFPDAVISLSGDNLPDGLNFTDIGDGTATIDGAPTADGVFAITITADNDVGANATQSFTLTVNTP